MATNVLLPQWGMNMEEGTLVRWLVKEGDQVQEGQPLVEVETAKINSELESPASGVVAHILYPEGSTVEVGTVIAVIARPGEEVPRPQPAEARRVAPTAPAPRPQPAPTPPREEAPPATARPRVQVVPRARLLARQHGIDLAQVRGTGPGGRITVEDVQRAIARQALEPKVRETIPLRGARLTIARRMAESVRTIPHVTLTTEVDFTEAAALRQELVALWRPHGIRPLDLYLVVRAVAASLAEHRRLNAHLVEDELRVMEDVNVAVAVALPDGLAVPVLRGADGKDLLTTARELRDLMERARRGTLTPDDVVGATFTVTSLAGYEVDAFTPIIDPPQVAILGVGRAVERPAVHGGQVVPRRRMVLSLSFDHRALDGAPAGAFLLDLKARLEAPSWMLGQG